MQDELNSMVVIARKEIGETGSLYDLQNVRSRYLGKKSLLNAFMSRLGDLPKEERPGFGKLVNDARQIVESLLSEREAFIREEEYLRSLASETVDLSMPGNRRERGALHPITRAWRELEDLFIGLGFEVAEGFDIEDEFHNFDALNHPHDHPARDLSDTFYIDRDVLLRTHTSPVQVRVMEQFKPPIRIISPGRTYRNDNDASHSPAFHQMECLVVDEGVSFSDLRDAMRNFVQLFFGRNTDFRIRPHFFPFTEPSAELDIQCVKCGGTGCNVCKGSGWLEIGGAGMVDPNVFRFVDIDPERYTGYAFGFGIDRIAMLKYRIPDMRLIFENDYRFLKQFA